MSQSAPNFSNRPQLTIVGASMPARTLAYLATPYSKYEGGNLALAFRDAARLAAQLMQAGVIVYSPIAHTHPLAIYGDIDPLDHDIWLLFDEIMMARCDVLIVAQMNGWKESKGIDYEVRFFAERKRTIFMLDPVSMNMRRMLAPLTSPAVAQPAPGEA